MICHTKTEVGERRLTKLYEKSYKYLIFIHFQ